MFYKVLNLLVISVSLMTCRDCVKRDDNILTPEVIKDLNEGVKITDRSQFVDSLSQFFFTQIIEGRSWIQAKNTISDEQNGLYLYFQEDKGKARNLRLRIQFENSTNYTFSIDRKSYSYKANRSKTSDPNFVDGGISWYDNNVREDDLKFIESIIDSYASSVTLDNGTRINLDSTTKNNLQKTLSYFVAKDGQLPRTDMLNIRRY